MFQSTTSNTSLERQGSEMELQEVKRSQKLRESPKSKGPNSEARRKIFPAFGFLPCVTSEIRVEFTYRFAIFLATSLVPTSSVIPPLLIASYTCKMAAKSQAEVSIEPLTFSFEA